MLTVLPHGRAACAALVAGFLAVVSFSSFTYAESGARSRLLGKGKPAPVSTAIPPLLFEVEKQNEILTKGKETAASRPATPLLPNRVYLVFDETFRRWYFELTDFSARLPEGVEALRWSTVLPGSFLGAKKPDQRYLYTEQGIWVPSFKNELRDFWIPEGLASIIRLEEFFPAGAGAIPAGTKKPTSSAEASSRNRLLNPNNLSTAKADERDKAPRLYDGVSGKPKPASSGAFLSHRVYAIYDPDEKAWTYALTNHYGKFPEPLEVLYPDTILEGKYLGALASTEFFRLNQAFGWEPTKETRRRNILVSSEPARFKRVRYTQHMEPPPKRFK